MIQLKHVTAAASQLAFVAASQFGPAAAALRRPAAPPPLLLAAPAPPVARPAAAPLLPQLLLLQPPPLQRHQLKTLRPQPPSDLRDFVTYITRLPMIYSWKGVERLIHETGLSFDRDEPVFVFEAPFRSSICSIDSSNCLPFRTRNK